MKKYLASAALLLTLAPLSACSSMSRPEWLGGENPRPAADVTIERTRRFPVLQKVPMTPPPPMPTQEYNDDKAITPPPPPAPDKQVMNELKVRKPFAGDPGYSMATETTAPVPPSPELGVSLEPRPAMVEEVKPVEASPPPPMEKQVSDKPSVPEAEKVTDKPYPKLSDVPERPTELTDMKAAQAEKIEELTAEHAAAEEQRETLAAEPTATAAKSAPAAETKSDSKKSAKTESTAKPSATETALTKPLKISAPSGKYAQQLEQEQALY